MNSVLSAIPQRLGHEVLSQGPARDHCLLRLDRSVRGAGRCWQREILVRGLRRNGDVRTIRLAEWRQTAPVALALGDASSSPLLVPVYIVCRIRGRSVPHSCGHLPGTSGGPSRC